MNEGLINQIFGRPHSENQMFVLKDAGILQSAQFGRNQQLKLKTNEEL